MVSVSDIVGKYVVKTLGGEAQQTPVQVELTENEGKIRFHAQVANAMNGNLTLENDTLKGMLMSTMMMGPPDLMKVEGFFGKFMEGIKVKKDGANVVLTADGTDLVLAPQ